jgi:hypothetical protein
MTNACSIDSFTIDPEIFDDSPTPRTLKEAIALWESLRDRNQRIRERFQSLHPDRTLLRSSTLQPDWART